MFNYVCSSVFVQLRKPHSRVIWKLHKLTFDYTFNIFNLITLWGWWLYFSRIDNNTKVIICSLPALFVLPRSRIMMTSSCIPIISILAFSGGKVGGELTTCHNYRRIDMVFVGNCGFWPSLKNRLQVKRQKAARKSTL